jgi:hypothetical protein
MSYKKSLEDSISASKAEYKQLGKSGLRISVPILGAMSFGDPEWQSWVLDEEKSLPLLKAAYDRGLNTWDTADIYSNGASEKIIGKALKKYQIPRHKVVILSKCFAYIGEEHVSIFIENYCEVWWFGRADDGCYRLFRMIRRCRRPRTMLITVDCQGKLSSGLWMRV